MTHPRAADRAGWRALVSAGVPGLAWLVGVNPLLGDRRPIDLTRLGRTEELMRAIRAERADTYGERCATDIVARLVSGPIDDVRLRATGS